MYSDHLEHHGIKGQKWGVRRYQNPDGSWTEEGKRRRMYRDRTVRAGKTYDDVEQIFSKLTPQMKDWLMEDPDADHYTTYEAGSQIAKRIIEKHGDTPVAVYDVWEGDKGAYNISILVDPDYQGRGYGKKVAQKGAKWLDKQDLGKHPAYWGADKHNKASRKIAEDTGFVNPEEWNNSVIYEYKKNKYHRDEIS